MGDWCQRALACIFVFLLVACAADTDKPDPDEQSTHWQWETLELDTQPTARHEASLVAHKGKLYLIGGRRINPIDVFDPALGRWVVKSKTPIELHHFQAVSLGDAIYLIGAMTGQWPYETPLERVIAYYPDRDEFEYLHEIPEARRRGGAGAVVHEDKIYILGGITNGHWDGSVAWLDVYDPATGAWEVLPDAPHRRDHFAAAVVDGKIYGFGGRQSLQRDNKPFELTTAHGDIYDIGKGAWETVYEHTKIPTQRAGGMAIAWEGQIITGGGESGVQVTAHSEVEVFNAQAQYWTSWPALQRGRHGSGFAIIGDYLYVASGCGNRGGEPELTSIERLKLPSLPVVKKASAVRDLPVHQQWHEVRLDFAGPETSEGAQINPFTDYRLMVEFTHGERAIRVRGHYAADGQAGQTGAQAGNVWRVLFAPDQPGEWRWRARFATAPMIAIDTNWDAGERVTLDTDQGSFLVEEASKDDLDFTSRGKLVVDNGYFRFDQEGPFWLKGGANSPENLLAFVGFDGTFRIETSARDGEASVDGAIHHYQAHRDDWLPGDPLWREGQGKGLIGAINYLAQTGMNAAYFLTLNILGDGKDVWPYRSPDDFTRFDVSKLDQWNRVFAHMQQKGILLHIVTQETENERMLDEGDTGPLRKLYYLELISRFAHHPGLVWNLGEENGPAHWLPEGQTTEQRKAMASFIKAHDPYNHPVLLHTHSSPQDHDAILEPLLGFEGLDGLSFQVAERETINAEIQKWRTKSAAAGQPWVITMDEVGLWHTGAKIDQDDPTHDSLRRHALWGAIMAGAGGVEWYFGAHQPHNDLTSEDWRQRANLWSQTRHALDFFTLEAPFWQMQPCADQIGLGNGNGYCMADPGALYVVYRVDGEQFQLTMPDEAGGYHLRWFDPVTGIWKTAGERSQVNAGSVVLTPPDRRDWVAVLSPNSQGQ